MKQIHCVSWKKKPIQAQNTWSVATQNSKTNTFNMNTIHLPHSSNINNIQNADTVCTPTILQILRLFDISVVEIFILCVIFGFCIFINMIIITYDGFCASTLSISDNLFFVCYILVIHISNIGSLCNLTGQETVCGSVH